jgi:hypothetical protein
MFDRTIKSQIKKKLFSGKAIIILGPRQVGKTTLVQEILSEYSEAVLYMNGDDLTVSRVLEEANTQTLKQIIGNKKIVFIDEAQRISRIGLTSKIIVDNFKNCHLILCGSSSFDLNQKIQEPLTGRKWTFKLWPISWSEYENHHGFLHSEQDLENRLVYGMYPDVLNNTSNQEETLKELVESYLFKDVLMLGNIKKPQILEKILFALSYQVGSEVRYNEVARTVGADPKTVESYVDLLEKSYVIFTVPSFSGNLRAELKKSRKIYFYDNGIRNAVINDFRFISNRQDTGALWENFLMSERLKRNSYQKANAKMFFWRTKQQQEIDYIEQSQDMLSAFEFKWSSAKKARFSVTFTKNYNSTQRLVNRDNFRDFLVTKETE